MRKWISVLLCALCLLALSGTAMAASRTFEEVPASQMSLILPEGHASQYSPELQTKIAVFRAGKPVVEFCRRLDDGSMLSLEEKISNLRNERQLWPGVLRL